MKSSPRSLILLGLWGFLLGWTYLATEKYRNEDTAFNHFDIAKAFQWPVVNICPMYLFRRNISRKTFEEMEVEINQTILSYSQVVLFPKGVTIDDEFK